MTWPAWVGLAFAAAVLATLAARRALHELARRRHWRIGRWSKVLPGWNYGGCLRCGTSWAYVRPHDTPYSLHGGRAVFPLCDRCWTELGTPGARITYYERLFAQWDSARWEDEIAVRAAVQAGL